MGRQGRLLVVWSPPDPAAAAHALTTDAERTDAARFRQPVDADRRLTARVLVRLATASLVGRDPDAIVVGAEPTGRPLALDTSGSPLPVHVSITHAGAHVGVAAATVPVGLDVQDVAALADVLDSPLVWTPTERSDLAALPRDEQLATAATWWTAKEAVLKSLGRGLLDPAEELDVRRSPVPWRSLPLDADHAAAIAGHGLAPGEVEQLHLHLAGVAGRHRLSD